MSSSSADASLYRTSAHDHSDVRWCSARSKGGRAARHDMDVKEPSRRTWSAWPGTRVLRRALDVLDASDLIGSAVRVPPPHRHPPRPALPRVPSMLAPMNR